MMNLVNKISWNELQEKKEDIKKVFFYRICGTGMGAAACLLKEKGYDVEGGDVNFYPPMSTYLESTGIPLHNLNDFDLSKLKDFDLIVVGNVVPGTSDVARKIESLGTSFCSFPQALGSLVLDDINVIGVAGTHGKTTTTYLATQVFEGLGEKPGYFVGGVIDGRSCAKLGEGKYFFIESDEYDSAYFEKISKFRLYSIKSMILTSLEFDHADIFDDIEDIKDQFRAVIGNIKKLIVNTDYKAVNELVDEMSLPCVGYGKTSKIGPTVLSQNEKGTVFSLKRGERSLEFKTNLVGEHNILNLTTVILYALDEGFSYEKIYSSVQKLQMVKRRQEVKGEYKGMTVIDDFAHHPRAVELTIDSIRTKYPTKKLIVVMEPNSATARSSIFQNEFEQSLKNAEIVIFTRPSRPTSVKDVGNLDYQKIVDSISSEGRVGYVANDLKELQNFLDREACDDNLVLVLSNGTCLGLWESELVKKV